MKLRTSNRFMKPVFFLSLLLWVISPVTGQNRVIKGQVFDASTKKTLPYANVAIEKSNRGVAANREGRFEIAVPSGQGVTLKVSYMGYASATQHMAPGQTDAIFHLRQDAVDVPAVTVVSSRLFSTVRDEAMPMAVMQSSRIDDLAPVTVSDALDVAPGLSMSRDGAWGSHVVIRGLSKQKVVTLVDGFRVETATNLAAGLSLIDTQEIERIEVIKGAASTLYGSGAMGGVIHVISKPGLFTDQIKVHGRMTTGFQSANKAATGHLSLTASGSRWYVKGSGTLRNADDVRTPEGTLANSQFRDQNISMTAGVKVAANQDLKLHVQRFDAEDVGIPGGTPFPVTATARYPEENRRLYSAEYRLHSLSTVLPEVSVKLFQQSILRDVELIPNPNVVVRPGGDHLTRGGLLQMEWLPKKQWTLTTGVDVWQRNLETWRSKHIIPQNKIVGENPVPNSTYQSIGVFAQNRFPLSSKVSVTLGGRADRIKVTNEEAYNPEYLIQDGNRIERPGNNRLWAAGEASDWSGSGHAGLLWSLAKDLDLTFNAARSFRSPTLEERYQYIELGGATYWGDPNLKSEVGNFMDLGVRLWKSPLTVTANVFYNKLTNLVVDGFVEEGLYRKTNVGEARLVGFDVDWQYRFGASATFYGNAAYVRGEDTENDEALPEIPPFEGRVGLRFSLGHFALLDLNVQSAASQSRIAAGEVETDGYTAYNASVQSGTLALAGVKGRLVVGVDNITDVAYRRHLSTYRGLIRLEPGRNVRASWLMEL